MKNSKPGVGCFLCFRFRSLSAGVSFAVRGTGEHIVRTLWDKPVVPVCHIVRYWHFLLALGKHLLRESQDSPRGKQQEQLQRATKGRHPGPSTRS